MGCCISTNRGSPRGKEAHLQVGLESFHQKPSLESRAPPPSAEEETVKEVLSETPKSKAHIFIAQEEEENKKTQIEKPVFVKIQEKESRNFSIKTEPKSPVIEESASEDFSEICSVSLSESVSTITDRRDEEEELRQQKVFRSPARTGSRNRVLGRSPTRKPDQSPGRRNGVVNGGSSVRLVQSREPTVRRGSRPDPPMKDPGESSGRRSRSPAVNRSVMGRSPSGRRTNQSPGRVRRDPAECGNSKKVEQQHVNTTTMEGKWPSSNNNGATTSAPNESLENPLVSLECFIFL
ncbi:serine/arginine repetitive matrix protein 1-like [Durio zibethinus]|uniref:Serine/arginine repetitive matrix protein 1-like n=1 Tax=Durio zibethinus TaxID=66656 RepID=A0A6P5WY98_DURZI|nr:serine/arginine repetitive matrix protein 1-like [Durio zibethinus]